MFYVQLRSLYLGTHANSLLACRGFSHFQYSYQKTVPIGHRWNENLSDLWNVVRRHLHTVYCRLLLIRVQFRNRDVYIAILWKMWIVHVLWRFVTIIVNFWTEWLSAFFGNTRKSSTTRLHPAREMDTARFTSGKHHGFEVGFWFV